MKKKKIKTSPRRRYDTNFKEQAIRLVQDLGSVQIAADKLGMTSYQTLGAWVRDHRKMEENESHAQFLDAQAEIKRLKKSLEKEKKVNAMLRDATAFFCQEQQK